MTLTAAFLSLLLGLWLGYSHGWRLRRRNIPTPGPIPTDRQCSFGMQAGKRCKKTGYWESIIDGESSGLCWCSTHRPRIQDEHYKLRPIGGGDE